MNKSTFSLNSFILLGSLDCCFGLLIDMDVICKYKIPDFEENAQTCYIDAFPLVNSTQENVQFRVEYADPSQIEEVRFVTTVDYVPKQILTTFPNLHILYMDSTGLEELNPGDFTHALNLRTLGLRNNKLKLIKSNVFSPIATMEDSTAHPNGVPNIPSDSVGPLRNLFKLLLNGNDISEIEDEAFNGLTDLFELQLDFNELNAIRRRTFVGLPSLRNLDLSVNRIAIIEDDAFDLPELIKLDISFNQLKQLSDTVFDGTPKLTRLQLHSSHLEGIGRSLYGLTQATSICLSSNSITDIDLAAFAQMPQLKELDLAASGFTFRTTYVANGQHGNSSLKLLKINDNKLSDATELNKLKIFPNVRYLYIGENAFADLDVGYKRTMKDILPSLKTLFICGMQTSYEHHVTMWQILTAANINYSLDCTKIISQYDD